MKKIILLLLLLTTNHVFAMGYKPEHITADSTWLVEFQQRIQEYDTLLNKGYWELKVYDSTSVDINKYSRKLREIVYHPYNKKRLDRIQGIFPDSLMNRVARVTYINLLNRWNKLDSGVRYYRDPLTSKFISYRADFEGQKRSNKFLRNIIGSDLDRQRRKDAWLAKISISPIIAEDLKKLIKERNRFARGYEFDNYYEFQLSKMGMTDDDLIQVLNKIENVSRKPYLRILERLKDEASFDTVEVWDVSYLFKSIPYNITTLLNYGTTRLVVDSVFASLGLSLDTLRIRTDFEERENKLQISFCAPITIPHDIAVSSQYSSGFTGLRTLLHENGHAVYFSHINQQHYSLKNTPASCLSEGMAMFIGEYSNHPDFWLKFINSQDSYSEISTQQLKVRKIYILRRLLALIYFERDLYLSDGENPNDLYWYYQHGILFVNPQPSIEAWAWSERLVFYPVYNQNYVIGELIASQTRAYLTAQGEPLMNNPNIGLYLKEKYFNPGASKDWFELVEDATGEPLTTKHLISEMFGEQHQPEIID